MINYFDIKIGKIRGIILRPSLVISAVSL